MSETAEKELTHREFIREQYEKKNSPEPEKKAEEKPDLKPTEKAPEVVIADAPVKEPTTPSVEKKPDVEMVPHQALHEEREKHKSTKAELAQAREQLGTVLQDVKKLMDDKKPEFTEPIDDYEKELIRQRQEIAALKADQEKRSISEKADQENRQAQEMQKRLSDADTSLESDGFPGFRDFVPLVTAELQRLVALDSANSHLDTPEGWKKIYKESIYPKVAKLSAEKKKDEKFDEKRKLKERANLAGSPGSAPSEEETKDEGWTYEDYIAQRRKRGL